MKILYASKSPLAGVCELMCRIVNEYTEHEARVLNRGPGRHRWYCRPGVPVPRYNFKKDEERRECLEWADVIHCMANVGVINLQCPDLLKKKVWVFQWHGAQIWPFSQVWRSRHYRYVRWIHIGQGWIEGQMDFFGLFIKKWGLKVIPNLITIDDELHQPLPWDERSIDVAFAPSTSSEGAVNRKGIPQVEAACRRVVKLDKIHHATFENCMKRKQRARLGIDEVVTPMYHRSGLEFLSQATPCVCSYNADTERVLLEATGADRMPFINSTPSGLRGFLVTYFQQPEVLRRTMSQEAREWIEKYYHPKELIKRHLEVYER